MSRGGGRARWAALVVLCVGQLMIVLDATVVNVALPTIQRELHFSQASLSWVINGYLLTFGGLLMLAGRIGDLAGRKTVFLSGLAAFTLTSMWCGLSPSAAVLVCARFVQGATAAMVAAMALGIITPMFPEAKEKNLALSVFAFVAIGGASLGLVVGGFITYALSWRWIFFINVPVGAVACLFGRRLIDPDRGQGIREGADLLGAALVTACPALAVYGVVNAGNSRWASATTLGSLGGAVVLGALFVVVESQVTTPLIPLRILRNRDLASGTVVRLLLPVGGYGLNFLGALYVQHILGYTPLQTGLAFLPYSVLTGIVSLAVTPRMVARVGLKAPTVAGLTMMTCALALMLKVSPHSSYLTAVLPTMVLMGIGIGLLFMPTLSYVMSAVEPGDTGLASGIANVSIQIGASLAVAALASVSASRTTGLLHRHYDRATALVDGYRLAFGVATAVTGLSVVVALTLLRGRRLEAATKLTTESPVAVPEG